MIDRDTIFVLYKRYKEDDFIEFVGAFNNKKTATAYAEAMAGDDYVISLDEVSVDPIIEFCFCCHKDGDNCLCEKEEVEYTCKQTGYVGKGTLCKTHKKYEDF